MNLTEFRGEFGPGSKVNPSGRSSGIRLGVRANLGGVRTG